MGDLKSRLRQSASVEALKECEYLEILQEAKNYTKAEWEALWMAHPTYTARPSTETVTDGHVRPNPPR